MKVRDIMIAPVETARTDTDLGAVARTMWEHDCGIVPVVDAAGKVIGVVTDRDVCMATMTRHLLPERISAAQAMHSPVHACLADDPIESALDTMRKFQIRRVPVIDHAGQLVGIVSLNDIVRASETRGAPASTAVVSTLAAVCAHRHAVVGV